MKTSRKDQLAIASLLYENADILDDGMGMDDGIGGGMETDVVMEIDPVAPVEPSFEADDDLFESIKGDLKKLEEFSSRLKQVCQPNSGLEGWMVAKISKAADYISDVYFCLDDQVDFANNGFEQAPDSQNLGY